MHYPDGQAIRLGDRMALRDGSEATVVCSIDAEEYSPTIGESTGRICTAVSWSPPTSLALSIAPRPKERCGCWREARFDAWRNDPTQNPNAERSVRIKTAAVATDTKI